MSQSIVAIKRPVWTAFFWLLCTTAFVYCLTTSLRVTFVKTHTCPSNATLSELSCMEGVADPRTCFVDCTTNSSCAVVFRRGPSDCYFGTQQQLNSGFSPTNSPGSWERASFVKQTPSTMAPISSVTSTSSTSSPLVGGLSPLLAGKFVLLFDFRQGFTILIDPSKYVASSHGSVMRDNQGAHFPGDNNADYIEVNTENNTLASTYLGHGNNFTFYASLFRRKQTPTAYHYFHDCGTSATNRGEFGDTGSRGSAVHSFPSASGHPDTVITAQSTTDFFSNGNNPQFGSIAVIFQASAVFNFFGQNAISGATTGTGDYSGPPLCLRLGYHSDSARGINNRLICYSIVRVALSLSELQELNAFCTPPGV